MSASVQFFFCFSLLTSFFRSPIMASVRSSMKRSSDSFARHSRGCGRAREGDAPTAGWAQSHAPAPNTRPPYGTHAPLRQLATFLGLCITKWQVSPTPLSAGTATLMFPIGERTLTGLPFT